MESPGSPNGWQVLYNHPIGNRYHLYTTSILPIRWFYITYHPLGEPETAIDVSQGWNWLLASCNSWKTVFLQKGLVPFIFRSKFSLLRIQQKHRINRYPPETRPSKNMLGSWKTTNILCNCDISFRKHSTFTLLQMVTNGKNIWWQ